VDRPAKQGPIMWNLIAIDQQGDCLKLNDQPLESDEVSMLIDRLEDVRIIILQVCQELSYDEKTDPSVL
jgi:hypothetical protein